MNTIKVHVTMHTKFYQRLNLKFFEPLSYFLFPILNNVESNGTNIIACYSHMFLWQVIVYLFLNIFE